MQVEHSEQRRMRVVSVDDRRRVTFQEAVPSDAPTADGAEAAPPPDTVRPLCSVCSLSTLASCLCLAYEAYLQPPCALCSVTDTLTARTQGAVRLPQACNIT